MAGEQVLGVFSLEFSPAGAPLVRAAPFTVNVIPEPGSLALLLAGALALRGRGRRPRRV